MQTNRLKEKMQQQQPCLGTFFHLGSANAVECLGKSGLDFIIIDLEHGPFSPETALDFIRAAELHQLTALARVSEISRAAVMRPLDVGAGGLIIPCVKTIDEVERIVEYAKFAPLGKRGFSSSRRDTWGFSFPATENITDNMRINNEETLVIPQCETVPCLEQIEKICALSGVDGIFIGPFDLSISLGIPGQFTHPTFVQAVARILAACQANHKFSFVFTSQQEAIQPYFQQGFDAVTYSLDATIFCQSLREITAKVRGKEGLCES